MVLVVMVVASVYAQLFAILCSTSPLLQHQHHSLLGLIIGLGGQMVQIKVPSSAQSARVYCMLDSINTLGTH